MRNLFIAILLSGWCLFQVPGTAFGQLNPEKLDFPINSDLFDEASPVISLDGRFLYFTRSKYPDFCRSLVENGEDLEHTLDSVSYWRKLSSIYGILENKPSVNPLVSEFNQDIFIVPLNNGVPGKVKHPCFPLNNALPNSVVSAFLDSNTIVVINQFYRDGSMYEGFSYQKMEADGSFTFPQPLHIYDFYSLSSDINLALSHDGDIMILSVKREDSRGLNDLYVSFKVKEGLWSAPKNMGRINTPFQETTPFISRDKRKLYFSSNRPGGAGGNDIFVCDRLDYTWLHWSDPYPLVDPINSEFDDAQPFLDDINSYLYFSSKREGTSDIYRVALKPKPKLKENIFVMGKILNSETGEPIRSELLWGPEGTIGFLEYFNSYNGEFELLLTDYEVYKFLPRKPGFDSEVTRFDARIADQQDQKIFEVTLYLTPTPIEDDPSLAGFDMDMVDIALPDPIPGVDSSENLETIALPEPVLEEKPTRLEERIALDEPFDEKDLSEEPDTAAVVINFPAEPMFRRKQKLSFYNIYFERSRADVRPESYRALNGLVKTLDDNPNMKILIEGHTDNIGDENDLVELSWKRAKAIKDHLVRYGISENRVFIYGYGASRPLTDNSNEDQRKRNRRVEVYSLED